MTWTIPRTQLQLRSLVRSSGQLELSLAEIPVSHPGPDDVLVRIEATPINPSDQGLLFGAADMGSATATGTRARPVITAPISGAAMKAMAGRLDQSLPLGYEAAGVVVESGDAPAAQALLGKKVAILGSATYSQYCKIAAGQCLVLPDDVSAAEGASAFINPMTALGMLHTMRSEGHHAIVHTAAASNLGQMLHRLCAADGIALVNVVRGAEQASLLRAMGAVHVCNSGSPHFVEELTAAMVATDATIAFDAIGGGPLAGQILSAMEAAANRKATTYSRYGSTVHKQVYIYGGLDTRPVELVRDFGMAWGVGGWLVMTFLQRIGPEAVEKLKRRVAGELQTTFASKYSQVISLQEALQPDVMDAYRKRATGQKYLINPNKEG